MASDGIPGDLRAVPIPSRPSELDLELQQELVRLSTEGRLRSTRVFDGPDRVHGRAPQHVVSFCSNDYLGLAAHPALTLALTTAATATGVGAGASRLVNGESPQHLELEAALAAFVHRPAALVYPTGYLTNMGVITALAGPEDLIVSDAANHASIIDGCRLSRAHIQIYPHGDAKAAGAALATFGTFRRRLLVTESIFSMDGDRAPLAELAALADRHHALLIVDEAHAIGISGPHGRGLSAALGITPAVVVGTLGKAFGTAGGFATGSDTLRSYLINRSRPFIYSTAPSPALAAASLAAVRLVGGAAGDGLRARAHAVATRIRQGLPKSAWPLSDQDLIIPFIVGNDRDALALSARLLDRGILVPAIRPPTVATGTARLRITASATHSDADVDALLAALAASGVA